MLPVIAEVMFKTYQNRGLSSTKLPYRYPIFTNLTKQKSPNTCKCLGFNAIRTRLELATSCVTGRRSNQLNYRTINLSRFKYKDLYSTKSTTSLLLFIKKQRLRVSTGAFYRDGDGIKKFRYLNA